jgi:hypothetical protein
MLRLSLFEIFVRTIPEGVLFIFANYILSNTKIEKKKLLISGILLGISTYLVRLLPINFGVHIIINLMIHIFLLVQINGIDVFKAVATSLIAVIILLLCEWLNFLILDKGLRISAEIYSKDALAKELYFLPSLLLFFLIIMGVFYTKYYLNKVKD